MMLGVVSGKLLSIVGNTACLDNRLAASRCQGGTPRIQRNAATIASMRETLRAVFENSVFRPLKRPNGLAEGREVTLTVIFEEGASSLADFAGRISLDDAREMREVIERDFECVDPRE